MMMEPPGTKVVRVPGNRSLLLAEHTYWTVRKGAIAVFAVQIAGDKPTGARRYLFTCKDGDLVCGGRSAESAGRRGILVVGLEEAELCPNVLADRSDESVAGGLPPGSRPTSEQLEGWIQRVAELFGSDSREGPVHKIPEEGKLRVPPDQSFLPPDSWYGWVQVVEGQVWLRGNSSRILTPDDGLWVPCCRSLWIKTTPELSAELAFRRTHEFPEPGALHTGLSKLHTWLFEHLGEIDAQERQQQSARLERRGHLERVETGNTLSELVGVLGKPGGYRRRETEILSALDPIGTRLGITFRPPAASELKGAGASTIDAIARASRLRIRRVLFQGDWWRRDNGPLLAFRGEDKRPVALLPTANGYELLDPSRDECLPVDQRVEEELEVQAISFVRPFPERLHSLWQLSGFGLRPFRRDAVLILLFALATTLLGMLVAPATQLIIDHAIPGADRHLLLQITGGLLLMAIGRTAFELAEGTLVLRVMSGLTAELQAATMDRLLRLKSTFFRKYSSGDLANRAMMITEISHQIGGTAVTGLLTSGMAALNLALCFYYCAPLAFIAAATAGAAAAATSAISIAVRRHAIQLEQGSGKLFGLGVQLIGGITKLRVAGAELRAFNFWARQYATQLHRVHRIQRWNDFEHLVSLVLSTASMIALFFFAARLLAGAELAAATGVAVVAPVLTMGTFLAFHSAFTGVVEGTTAFGHSLVDLMDVWAKKELIRPVLDAELEVDASKVDPGRLTGELRVDKAVFRYRDDGPLILNGVSVRAAPGEFIALVGPSGSGKSTLFKLLLGFEAAESGGIYFDGQNLTGLDSSAVRRQIGVVLQMGRINAAPIFENIAAGNVITLDEAWTAARDAGFDADIEQMPMGMHTVLNEGASNLSGGQRQRLMIARALATNPKILLFDEATSALDNRTQRIVSESVRRRRVTRVVVAHRLSTIRDADRIYVLEAGRVVQEGSFQDLMREENGLFARMVARQIA